MGNWLTYCCSLRSKKGYIDDNLMIYKFDADFNDAFKSYNNKVKVYNDELYDDTEFESDDDYY